jgi:hypothetical protein
MIRKIGGRPSTRGRELSVVEQRIVEREAFLRLYRRAYVRSIGAELGIIDLSVVALREAASLVDFANELRGWATERPKMRRVG